MSTYISAAFEKACKGARRPREWHTCLIETRPFYGGPEEGGWWGEDEILVAYKTFPTRRQAIRAGREAERLAREAETEARTAFGEHCLRQMEYLEDRGLEADWLPETDGPSSFRVVVRRDVPRNSYGCRHYE
jgi:hypothetical protein